MDFFLKFVVLPIVVGIVFFPLVIGIINFSKHSGGPPDPPQLDD